MNSGDESGARPPVVGDAASGPVDRVYRLVCDLIACYRGRQALPAQRTSDRAVVEQQLTSLMLAEAAIRLAQPAAHASERPAQLAVIGPTQVGKSTVVNLLFGQDVAQVSPLAGFTVHPQAFSLVPAEVTDSWADALFQGWRRCSPDELRRDDLETVALRPVDRPSTQTGKAAQGRAAALPSCAVWDTPDFDSLSAEQYQRSVLEVAAVADAYLLVLSKEKYADLSVWRMLRLLQPLGRPLVVCLNKLTPESAETVSGSLRRRLAESGVTSADVPIISLKYCAQLGSGAADALAACDGDAVQTLVEAVAGALPPVRQRPEAGLRALVRCHWDGWTMPVRAEQAAIEEWQRRIEAALEEFLKRYKRDYLDHPQRFDSFRRAVIELLHLLEVPKLSRWITTARQAVTWPLRQVWAAGRAWRGSRGGAAHDLGAEATVLFDTLETLLTALMRELARRCEPAAPGSAVWRAISRRIESQEARLRETFRTALEAHHTEVTREVHVAATSLYEELKQHPARLAALRTARATIDVGAVLLAVKTGGLSLADALWAPATFALSSLLIEGIAGVQMGSVARNLKKRQFEAVQEKLVRDVLAKELRGLSVDLDDAALFGIPAERLEEAGRALQTWEQQEDDG